MKNRVLVIIVVLSLVAAFFVTSSIYLLANNSTGQAPDMLSDQMIPMEASEQQAGTPSDQEPSIDAPEPKNEMSLAVNYPCELPKYISIEGWAGWEAIPKKSISLSAVFCDDVDAETELNRYISLFCLNSIIDSGASDSGDIFNFNGVDMNGRFSIHEDGIILEQRILPYSRLFIPYSAFPGKIAVFNRWDQASSKIVFRQDSKQLKRYIQGEVFEYGFEYGEEGVLPRTATYFKYPASMEKSPAKAELEKYKAKAYEMKEKRDIRDKPWLEKLEKIKAHKNYHINEISDLYQQYTEKYEIINPNDHTSRTIKSVEGAELHDAADTYISFFVDYGDFYANSDTIISNKTGKVLTPSDIFKNESWKEIIVDKITKIRYCNQDQDDDTQHSFSETKARNSLDSIRIGISPSANAFHSSGTLVISFDDPGNLGEMCICLYLDEIGLENLKI